MGVHEPNASEGRVGRDLPEGRSGRDQPEGRSGRDVPNGRAGGDLPEGRAKGELEAAILAVLHRAAPTPLTPGDVLEGLGDARLAYTTVVTTLTRLHAKGVLQRAKQGRAFAYAPVADESGLAARRMSNVLAGRHDREAVLAHFVDELSDADEELLRRLLDPGK